ncbi:MAG TPA: DinB family protein [Methylomirabilota bacterium]|nr:DinB family protein [Methylomirabilota bacterium]
MTAVSTTIADIYPLGHRNVLAAVDELGEDQIRWRPPRSNSIGFNLWHIARWADHMQSVVGALTPGLRHRLGPSGEIWTREALSARWGFPASGLGSADTGMGMDEAASAELPLPPKAELVAYATLAFAAADLAVREVRDDDLAHDAEFDPATVPWAKPSEYGSVADWIVSGIRHDSRHLGMIEALKGAVGLRGTATR